MGGGRAMRRRREVLGIAISVVALLSLSYLAVVEEFSPMVRGIIFVAWVMNAVAVVVYCVQYVRRRGGK